MNSSNASGATMFTTQSFTKPLNIKTGISRPSILLGFWLLLVALSVSTSAAVLFDPCQSYLSKINGLQAERASLQAELQHAAPGEKPALIHQIEELNSQIAKAQHDYTKCRETTDLVDTCPMATRGDRANYPDPNSYYRLPFENDPAWALANGNWDDPHFGHCKPEPGHPLDPNCLQAYAFDFTHPVGGAVLAARPGQVYDYVESQKGNSNSDRFVFFFKGGEFLIYDSFANKVTQGYKPISQGINNWPASWDNGFDDAVNWENGKIYFFKGSHYLRLDVATNSVDAGYPKPIIGNWGNWPQSWSSGIDAAYNWRGKAYFFKGSEYLVYSFDQDQVIAGPFSLTTITGWPASWASGVEAAMVGGGGLGKVNFFKGNQVLRYDILTKQVDAAPQNISTANWLNLPGPLHPGVDGAVRWNGGYSGVGNYLVIKHADGTFGVYWHLKQHGVMVNLGDNVVRGQTLAISGNTGSSSAPHLHFEVRQGWDKGFGHTNWNEFHSAPSKFEDANHHCWIPRVGDALESNNF